MSTEVEDFLAHHGIKGMKWGKRRSDTNGDGLVDDGGAGGGGGEAEEDEETDPLDELAEKNQEIENANNKFLAWKKLGNPLFDKSSFWIENKGAKFVKNSNGGVEFLYGGTSKAHKITKQGIVNRFVDKLFGREKKTSEPKLDKRSVIKSIGPESTRVPAKKK